MPITRKSAPEALRPVPEPYGRYLRLLGFNAIPGGLEGLGALVRSHLCRVPFENVSKLLLFGREGAGRVTSLGEFLDGIEREDLGGTCYTSNPFLAELLRVLGYDADLLGADMSTPNVHTVIRVRIGGVAYHVDVGYAAPLRRPVALDSLPFACDQGKYRYVLDHRSGRCRLTVWSEGERVHGYAVGEHPRRRDFFRSIILDSYAPGKTFMSCLRVARFFEDGTSVELKDATLIRSLGTESVQNRLRSMRELRQAVDRQLAMPRCPIEEAVGVLERVTGRPFFEGDGDSRV